MKKRSGALVAMLALVATLAVAPSAMAFSGLGNGSFEEGTITQTYSGFDFQRLSAGDTQLAPWSISAGTVDWIGTYWQAEDGTKSVDLDGAEGSNGAISQTVTTAVGRSYFVSFWLSGNPDNLPTTKTLTVGATGASSTAYSYTTTSANSRTNMLYVQKSYAFVATSASTTLTFTSTTSPAGYGPVVDNVVVTELAAATGANCKNGGWATMYDASGAPFKNQGACVSYFATSGATPIGPAAPAASQMAPLYDVTSNPSNTWDCALGATLLTGGTRGTVTWARVDSTVLVTVSVVGGRASATYDVWVEQNPGTCPPGTSSPSNPSAVVTDASGNGTASFSFTAVSGATNFWLSLWSPAGSLTGTSVLRSTAVVLQ